MIRNAEFRAEARSAEARNDQRLNGKFLAKMRGALVRCHR